MLSQTHTLAGAAPFGTWGNLTCPKSSLQTPAGAPDLYGPAAPAPLSNTFYCRLFFFFFFFLPQIFINPSEFHFLKYLFSLSFSVHIRFLLFQGKNAAEQKKLSILAQNKTIKKLHFCLLPLSSEDISLMLPPQTTPNPACSNPCCESDRAPPSRLKLPGDDRPQ